MNNHVSVAMALAYFGLAGPLAAQTITEFPLPTTGSPAAITAGPDGSLWFTEVYSNRIGRITTAGVVTEFPIPTANSFDGGPRVGGITAGPDGNLWFTNQFNNSIGRITSAGAVTNYTGTGLASPVSIAAGPDGNLWFTNPENNSIGRLIP